MSSDSPQVIADARAAEFLRSNGGALYIWRSEAGLEHETTKPKAGIAFTEHPGEGFTLYIDRTIEPANEWQLVYHRWPRPHVRALWNGAAFSPGASRLSDWEGGSPFR